MIAGINKIWYQHYGSIVSKGYSVNNTRVGLSFSTNWQLLNFSRDTAQFVSENKGVTYQHSVKYSNLTPSAIDLDFAKKLHSKLIVLALELNNGSTIIIGVENPLRVNFKYNTGQGPFDSRGYTVDINVNSKLSLENYEIFPFFYPKFGLIYNFYAVNNENILNNGWRIPTSEDFEQLITFLEGNINAGNQITENSSLYWNDIYTANNNAKFNARGAGIRNSNGFFIELKSRLTMATISDGFFNKKSYIVESVDNSYFRIIDDFRMELSVTEGRSIRGIKNTTNLSNGQSSKYLGNDGKKYRTICIGSQEWLADNLAETKYRDGSDIPNVTDNTQWANLTTGACCAYNNDPNNV